MLLELHRDSIQNAYLGQLHRANGPVQSYAPQKYSVDIKNGVSVALLDRNCV